MAEETPEPILTLEQVRQFFAARERTLNVSPIGEESGLAQGHLNKVLKGERGFTKRTAEKLLPVLKKYGYGYKE